MVELTVWMILLSAGGVFWGLAARPPVYPPGHCARCGYCLTGLAAGRCPECGLGS